MIYAFKQAIHVTMLAVASAGAVPLWLHHAHHHSCADHDAACCSSNPADQEIEAPSVTNSTDDCTAIAPASGRRCCESNSFCDSPGGDPASSDSGSISLGEHDCWVCFNLSQAPAPALTIQAELRATLVLESVHASARFVTPNFARPPPARGPPASV